MPGPLIRPPTKKQVVIGSICFAAAVGIFALAGATGTSSKDVAEERRQAFEAAQRSASPEPRATAAEECVTLVSSIAEDLIPAQDALSQAKDGGDFSEADLKDAAATAKKTKDGDDLADCEKTDPDAGDTINAGLTAVQAAAADKDLSESKAAGYYADVEDLLALAGSSED